MARRTRAHGTARAALMPPPIGFQQPFPKSCPRAIARSGPIMISRGRRGYDVMVACQLPKLNARVRFPLPAPAKINDLDGVRRRLPQACALRPYSCLHLGADGNVHCHLIGVHPHQGVRQAAMLVDPLPHPSGVLREQVVGSDGVLMSADAVRQMEAEGCTRGNAKLLDGQGQIERAGAVVNEIPSTRSNLGRRAGRLTPLYNFLGGRKGSHWRATPMPRHPCGRTRSGYSPVPRKDGVPGRYPTSRRMKSCSILAAGDSARFFTVIRL